MHDTNSVTRRVAGFSLAAGGVLFFLAGALHPHGHSGQSFRRATASLLADHDWPAAHWLALSGALVLAVAAWLLVDCGVADGALARIGARATVVACSFMAVQFAVELAARAGAADYAAGRSTPLVDLSERMQVVGWPALAVAFVLLAAGLPELAPRAVAVLGSAGAGAIGVGGVLVEGFHSVSAAPLFIGGNLLAVWIVWAAVRLLSMRPRYAHAPAERPAAAAS